MSEVRAALRTVHDEGVTASHDRITDTLRTLGVSGYAAQAFVALLRVPAGTAAHLVVQTGIADSKIYYALAELVEQGLVAVQAGKPKTYRAVPPRQVETRLLQLLQTRHAEAQARVRRLTSLLEPLEAASRSPVHELAYLVKGGSNVLARAQAMVGAARREVVFLVSDEPFFRKLEPDLRKAARRGVQVKLAVPAIALDRGLSPQVETRSILCSCIVLV
ncbi:MAG: TrmB family transcriptional regulator, partial [Gemmatimonadales bacterium]